jgi:hypothetical protein
MFSSGVYLTFLFCFMNTVYPKVVSFHSSFWCIPFIFKFFSRYCEICLELSLYYKFHCDQEHTFGVGSHTSAGPLKHEDTKRHGRQYFHILTEFKPAVLSFEISNTTFIAENDEIGICNALSVKYESRFINKAHYIFT